MRADWCCNRPHWVGCLRRSGGVSRKPAKAVLSWCCGESGDFQTHTPDGPSSLLVLFLCPFGSRTHTTPPGARCERRLIVLCGGRGALVWWPRGRLLRFATCVCLISDLYTFVDFDYTFCLSRRVEFKTKLAPRVKKIDQTLCVVVGGVPRSAHTRAWTHDDASRGGEREET